MKCTLRLYFILKFLFFRYFYSSMQSDAEVQTRYLSAQMGDAFLRLHNDTTRHKDLSAVSTTFYVFKNIFWLIFLFIQFSKIFYCNVLVRNRINWNLSIRNHFIITESLFHRPSDIVLHRSFFIVLFIKTLSFYKTSKKPNDV